MLFLGDYLTSVVGHATSTSLLYIICMCSSDCSSQEKISQVYLPYPFLEKANAFTLFERLCGRSMLAPCFCGTHVCVFAGRASVTMSALSLRVRYGERRTRLKMPLTVTLVRQNVHSCSKAGNICSSE